MNINRFVAFAAAVVLVALAVLPVTAQPPEPVGPSHSGEYELPQTEYVPGEILVKFKPTVGQLSACDSLAAKGL